MSDSTPEAKFHLYLLKEFINHLVKQPPFNSAAMEATDQDFLEQLVRLAKGMEAEQSDLHFLGQDLCTRLIRNYPRLAPLLDRELMWYFGGDCLHYMPDEEIGMYQQLDEMSYEAESKGESFDRREARANMLKKN